MKQVIHPTAIIDQGAKLGKGVEVGPYSIIGKNVIIGDNTKIASHCVIEGWTKIGSNNKIGVSSVIGAPPQDLKYKDFESYVEIGDNNILREFITVHRAADEGGKTVIGNDNMLMAFVHVAHNCVLGSGIVIANSTGLSGHVEVEDHAVIGGMTGIHQFAKIGKMAMVGGFSKVVKDVPPFSIADGQPIKLYGINYRGLARKGIDEKGRKELKKAYKYIMDSKLNIGQAVDEINSNLNSDKEVRHLVDFLNNPSRLGIVGK
ncbi:MAG: acyl-ACP--UDP-N-acetylglucosamine O-acyltransferase [Armatimonadota bacterium]